MKVSKLTAIYEVYQSSAGVPVKGASDRLIKARLKKCFEENLSFYKQSKTSSELIYSNASLLESGNPMFFCNLFDSQAIERAVKVLRDQIDSCAELFSSWLPASEELINTKYHIPRYLEQLLPSVLSRKVAISERIKRRVSSIGQDIIYNATRGKSKAQKHIQFGLLLKRKTSSKQMINICNRLAHCVSYDEVNIVETALADEQTKSQLYSAHEPINVQPSIFVSFVYHNCDYNPETLSGVTMHCTNGIIIQSPTRDPLISLPATPCTEEQRVKRRSFATITKELDTFYALPENLNPPTVAEVEVNNACIFEVISMKKDFVWPLARSYNNMRAENQIVPGWTGFHHELADETDERVRSVHYLPVIEDPLTKMSVVQETLNQIKLKAEKIGLSCPDAVFDHSIYAKALEAITNPANADLQRFINMRMGGFYASCIFIGVIRKRFSSAGLKGIIIEANLVGQGSVDSTLRGKMYSVAVRVLKTIYEAL